MSQTSVNRIGNSLYILREDGHFIPDKIFYASNPLKDIQLKDIFNHSKFEEGIYPNAKIYESYFLSLY